MNCEQTKPEIQAFCDGELHGRTANQVRLHIDTCDVCRDEFAVLRRLSAAIRDADYVTDASDRQLALVKPHARKLRQLAYMASIAAILSVVTLIIPNRHNASDPNAAVADALARVNTWHLSGWKQIDGQHMSWDIWGRRQPYLYYERVGQDITVDDGTTTRRILAPNLALGRPTGLVIETSDQTATDFGTKMHRTFMSITEPDLRTMIDGWDWLRGGGMFMQKPFKQSKDELSFRRQWDGGFEGVNAYRVFTISKRSWLPIRYEFDNRSAKGEWNTELLTPRYGVDLPDDVVSATAPAGYGTIDFTGSKAALVRKDAHTYAIGPFQVFGTLTAMDYRGNAIVGISTLMDGKPLEERNSTIFSVSTGLSDSPNTYGENGKHRIQYLYIDRLYPPDINGATPLFLAPLDELTASRLPDRITLNPTLSITIGKRDTDDLDDTGRFHPQNTNDALIQTHLPMTVKVDQLDVVRDIKTRMPADWQNYTKSNGLSDSIYQTRATWHYMPSAASSVFYLRHRKELFGIPLTQSGEIDLQALGSKPLNLGKLDHVWRKYPSEHAAITKFEMMRAVYWEQRSLDAIDEMPPSQRPSAAANDYRMMAIYYKAAGDKPAANRMLKAQLVLFKRMYPAKSTLVRQVEYEIKTGQLADDADFSGPS